MRIVGRGLIARSLEPYADAHRSTVAFAAGVAASVCEDAAAYQREIELLHTVIDEAVQNGERVVYFSGGGAIYSDWSRPAMEDDPVRPTSTYGRHQVECERILAERRVRHIIFRLPNVIGPTRNRSQLLPALVAQALAGRVIVQRGAERDLIGADDFARVASAILVRVDGDATINLATGEPVPVRAIVSTIGRVLRLSPRIEEVGEGTAQRFSIDRLKRVLGVDPFPRPYPVDVHLESSVLQIARSLDDVPA